MTESQTPEPNDYLRAIRRRWRIVLVITLLATATAVGVSLSGTKQYDAEAQLLFKSEADAERLVDPSAGRSEDPERVVNTGVQLIKLDAIAQAVRRRLGLSTSIEKLLERVQTDTTRDSDIASVIARAPDPRDAAAIANAFADEYVAYRRQAARETLTQAADLAQSEFGSLSPEDRASPQGQQLRARARELLITAALQTGGVEVVRRATPPTRPSRPRPKLSAALGLALGLLAGVAAALLLEFTDRRLRREEDIEALFELPILASIPPPPRRGGDDHVQREAFGLLATNVRFSALESDANVVMITSSSPSEGKTSVTLGLAQALARLGLRVIAIEADLRRPTFSQKAPLGPSAGLAGLLASPGPIAPELVWLDAGSLLPATTESLKDGLAFAVLPAGAIPPHPQRLLARPTMGSIIEQARSLADAVLIDTPPVGSVNDAATLAPAVDSAVVVAMLDHTTKDAARRALRGLRSLNVLVAGLVITNATEASNYGYYQSADDPPAPVRGEVAPG